VVFGGVILYSASLSLGKFGLIIFHCNQDDTALRWRSLVVAQSVTGLIATKAVVVMPLLIANSNFGLADFLFFYIDIIEGVVLETESLLRNGFVGSWGWQESLFG
jgi:hypothetical protein